MTEQQKILVVDDDKFNAALMTEICENAGYIVIEAYDGNQALDLAKEEKPDLILLDIMMGTKDGFQVCRDLRASELTSETPIILVTAVDDLDSKVRGIELGADDYITKPFRLFDLQTRIRSAIDARRYRQKPREDAEPQAEPAKQTRFRVGGYRQLRWDLDYEFSRATRYEHALSCVLLVIDKFERLYTDQRKKEAAGLIAAVVTVLQRTLRTVDRIYRIEDDVFVVVMPETTAEAAHVPIERVRTSLRAADASSSGPVTLTVSLVSVPDSEIRSSRDMLRLVTNLLSQAKPESGDQIVEKPT